MFGSNRDKPPSPATAAAAAAWAVSEGGGGTTGNYGYSTSKMMGAFLCEADDAC